LLDQFGALFLRESKLLVDRFDHVRLGQGHKWCPLKVRWLELIEFVKDTGFRGNCQRIKSVPLLSNYSNGKFF
jgi:hypothetical protein